MSPPPIAIISISLYYHIQNKKSIATSREVRYNEVMKNILILCRHDERPDYDQVDTFRHALGSIEAIKNYTYYELERLEFITTAVGLWCMLMVLI